VNGSSRDGVTPQARDWTTGDPHIAFETCARCGGVWYFRRGFCPRCGSRSVEVLAASGRGRVAAVARVVRAPTEALQALAPYNLVLVDAIEGFRLMAQGADDLIIGMAVQARFVSRDDQLIPFFDRDDVEA
jgi:uncharacterized protein